MEIWLMTNHKLIVDTAYDVLESEMSVKESQMDGSWTVAEQMGGFHRMLVILLSCSLVKVKHILPSVKKNRRQKWYFSNFLGVWLRGVEFESVEIRSSEKMLYSVYRCFIKCVTKVTCKDVLYWVLICDMSVKLWNQC